MKNSSAGVRKKIKEQEFALKQNPNNQIKLIILNPSEDSDNEYVKYVNFNKGRGKIITNLLLLFAKFYLIDKCLKLNNYDRVLLRYPGADLSGLIFMRKHKNVCFEFHAILSEELKNKIKSTKSYLHKILRLFRYMQEKFLQKFIVQKCTGLITMSDEIADNINKYLKKTKKFATIPNGINVNDVGQTGFASFNNKVLKVAFIGSRPESWHGLDRLIYSAKLYMEVNENIKIEFNFIGGISKDDIHLSGYNENLVKFHGLKFGADLDEIMCKMHLAVCQLALYRKGLNELSTLKSCEYIARGLPFILAYSDPNLYDVDEDRKFYLQFPNDESIIDFSSIIDFVGVMQNNAEIIKQYMFEYGYKHIDWKIKLKMYNDFLAKL